MEYRIAIDQQLAALLKSLRKQRKLSQKELGERLGMSQRMVAKLEAHPEASGFGRVFQALNALGVDLILRERDAKELDTSSAQNSTETIPW
jgi:HTH-type transcriptional regulator/antitoxin HipB